MASDVTEAATQDEIANSLVAEEPQEQVAEESPEQQPEQQVSEQQPIEQEQQPEQEELVEDWLPSEQDRTFSDEALLRYAQRYQKDEQWLSDPLNRQILVDKLNSDIFIRQQQEAQQYEPEPEPQAEPTREQPQISREQYFANLDRVIAERTDPEVAKSFFNDFMGVWKQPEAAQPAAFAQVASKYMLNLVQTFIPDMLKAQLGPQLDGAFPGFSKMYERSSHAMAWDNVRNSNPQFAALPAYGTKEFQQKLLEAAERVPEVAEMIDEAAGKPMNQTQVTRWYNMLARIASGQNVNPELLRQAANSGARNARRAEVRRSAGNLGSGKSNAATGSRPPVKGMQTNTDLFDEDTMDLYQREHGRL